MRWGKLRKKVSANVQGAGKCWEFRVLGMFRVRSWEVWCSEVIGNVRKCERLGFPSSELAIGNGLSSKVESWKLGVGSRQSRKRFEGRC